MDLNWSLNFLLTDKRKLRLVACNLQQPRIQRTTKMDLMDSPVSNMERLLAEILSRLLRLPESQS